MGKTIHDKIFCTHDQDHPHLRGENRLKQNVFAVRDGSSPLAWGKLAGRIPVIEEQRIIPTCVGKTIGILRDLPCKWDHPHLRGENLHLLILSDLVQGSSPLAWGKQFKMEKYA